VSLLIQSQVPQTNSELQFRAWGAIPLAKRGLKGLRSDRGPHPLRSALWKRSLQGAPPRPSPGSDTRTAELPWCAQATHGRSTGCVVTARWTAVLAHDNCLDKRDSISKLIFNFVFVCCDNWRRRALGSQSFTCVSSEASQPQPAQVRAAQGSCASLAEELCHHKVWEKIRNQAGITAAYLTPPVQGSGSTAQ